MLLDSALLYEDLKPVYFHLKNSYESQGKQVDALKGALRVSELQIKLQRDQIERIKKESKKREKKLLWRAIALGGILAAILII